MSEIRLIDANALKEDLRQYFTKGEALYQILTIIDNAPTVELFCAYLSDGEVRQPCVEGPCEDERPQGDCENCVFRKFSAKFIDDIVKFMAKNGIESVEQLMEILKGGDK